MEDSFIFHLQKLGGYQDLPLACTVQEMGWARSFFGQQRSRFEFAAIHKKRKLHVASCYSFEERLCVEQPFDPVRDHEQFYDLRGNMVALRAVLMAEHFEVRHESAPEWSGIDDDAYLTVKNKIAPQLEPVPLGLERVPRQFERRSNIIVLIARW